MPCADASTCRYRSHTGLSDTGRRGTEVGCVGEAELLAAVREIIGVTAVQEVGAMTSRAQIEMLQRQVDDAFSEQIGAIGRSIEDRLADVLSPITSFRQVDEGIDFISTSSPDLVGRLSGR